MIGGVLTTDAHDGWNVVGAEGGGQAARLRVIVLSLVVMEESLDVESDRMVADAMLFVLVVSRCSLDLVMLLIR